MREYMAKVWRESTRPIEPVSDEPLGYTEQEYQQKLRDGWDDPVALSKLSKECASHAVQYANRSVAHTRNATTWSARGVLGGLVMSLVVVVALIVFIALHFANIHTL